MIIYDWVAISTMTAIEPSKELLNKWRAGDENAATELHDRFAERIYRLAEKQINNKFKRRFDADDVVQSVLRTFFRRTEEGQYPVDDSVWLWRLLVKMTMNKIRKYAEREEAAKRNINNETYPDADSVPPNWLAREPSVNEATVLVDELASLVKDLNSSEAEIIGLCLQGRSTTEIAAAIGCSRWTVRRNLDRIGNRVRKQIEENPEI